MNDVRRNLVAFLRRRGWREPSAVGPDGALWIRPGTEWRVPVPHVVDEGAPDWPTLLERIARLEGMPLADVERRVHFASSDVVNLRAVDYEGSTNSIPYKTGVTLAQNGWKMLRACATTAIGVKANLHGSYRKPGDEIVEIARMAHTRPGSYIIPIYIPLSDPIELAETLPGSQTAEPDPPEQRVTRTLATALEAVDELVVQPARVPTSDGIHHLVATGVSKEFVNALGDVLSSDGLATFSTDFEWALTSDPPNNVDGHVEIPGAACKLVGEVAHRLGTLDEIKSSETLTGTIVGVHRDRDDSGRVTISSYRNGRACSVHGNVSGGGGVLNQALDWMKHKDTVNTKGMVRQVSDGLQCDGLDNIRLL